MVGRIDKTDEKRRELDLLLLGLEVQSSESTQVLLGAVVVKTKGNRQDPSLRTAKGRREGGARKRKKRTYTALSTVAPRLILSLL